MNPDEPVGSTGGGRHAPAMLPDDEPPSESHWCAELGARVYAPAHKCPACSAELNDLDDAEDGGSR